MAGDELLCRIVKPNPFRLAADGSAAPDGSVPAAESTAGLAGSSAATVDYRLSRAATLRAWRSGQLGRHEVCDAQRELHRNAEFCGQPTERQCPVCATEDLVEVTYVFGSRLPKHGRCVTTRAEMQRLQHRASVSTGYVVEVCTGCGWNHLVRRYTLGGRRSA